MEYNEEYIKKLDKMTFLNDLIDGKILLNDILKQDSKYNTQNDIDTLIKSIEVIMILKNQIFYFEEE